MLHDFLSSMTAWFPFAQLALSFIAAWLEKLRSRLAERRMSPPSQKYRRKKTTSQPTYRRTRRKPDWVRKKIIDLHTRLRGHGCRKLSVEFNRLHTHLGISVGKSTVATMIREHYYTIAQRNQFCKHRIPPPEPNNVTWGLDATGKTDESGTTHPILSIIDHGSRRSLTLTPLRQFTTISVLRALLYAIELFGVPKFIRTDNGSQFRSRLFRSAMNKLGIKQQFSKPGMPWMNGRIERFFGTLKERLNQLSVSDFNGLKIALDEFRIWYNQARPHQHLDGRTPYEAWSGIEPYGQLPKDVRYVVGWDGLLTGFYIQY